jgi:hypothetical protein
MHHICATISAYVCLMRWRLPASRSENEDWSVAGRSAQIQPCCLSPYEKNEKHEILKKCESHRFVHDVDTSVELRVSCRREVLGIWHQLDRRGG